LLSHYEKGDL